MLVSVAERISISTLKLHAKHVLERLPGKNARSPAAAASAPCLGGRKLSPPPPARQVTRLSAALTAMQRHTAQRLSSSVAGERGHWHLNCLLSWSTGAARLRNTHRPRHPCQSTVFNPGGVIYGKTTRDSPRFSKLRNALAAAGLVTTLGFGPAMAQQNQRAILAESNALVDAGGGGGIKGWIMQPVKKRAGAAMHSADHITLLRDSNGDGVSDRRTVFLRDLHSPFGMAVVGNTDAVMRFPWQPGQTPNHSAGRKLVDLPAGRFNRHWTRNLIASPDGKRLYVSIGSASNIAEHGLEVEQGRAAIWEVNPKNGEHHIFASGLRNPVGMAWQPETGDLWVAVNERDELGGDLVPDYMTRVRAGDFYGWPWSYFGRNLDVRVEPQRPDRVASAVVPDYVLGPHTASLGLSNAHGTTLPERFRNGIFVGQHGSWNRKPRSGYKVIFVPFRDGRPAGEPLDVLTVLSTMTTMAPGRRRHRQPRRIAGGRRCRQRRLACDHSGSGTMTGSVSPSLVIPGRPRTVVRLPRSMVAQGVDQLFLGHPGASGDTHMTCLLIEIVLVPILIFR